MAQRAGTEAPGAAEARTGANAVTQDIFLEACRGQAEWDRKVSEIRAGRDAFRKQKKSQGIVLGLLDSTLRKSDWERKEVQDHYATERQYAEWLGLPVGTQPDMFEGKDDDEIRARHWHAAGVTAQRSGKPRVLPGDVGPKFGPMWDRGYDGEPFVWEIVKASLDKAAAATQAGKPAGKTSGKPGAAAGKRQPSARAKKVAGLITPPPATHTGDDKPKGGKTGPVLVTSQSGVETVESSLTGGETLQAGGDDRGPAEDGFGKTGFGLH